MRASPLPLLLLLALGAAAASAPALLALRAACPPGLAAFDRALNEASSALAGRALRPLGHRETCGPEWRTWVTRGALGALAEGGSVLSAGRLGAVVCDALAAAAHALRRAAPEHCAGGAARGAAVARLAVRLGWRRALLASAADAECSLALRDAARALAAAGLAVWTAPVTERELTRRPHVVILCASVNDERREAGTFRWGSAGTGPPALLLHLADDGEAPVSFQNVEDALKLSNNTFTVDSSRKRDIRKSFSDEDANVDGGGDVFISLLRREDSLSTVASFNMSEPNKYTPPIDLLRSNAMNLTIKDKSVHKANDTYVGNGSRSRRESSRAVVTDIKTVLRFFILQEKYAFFQRLLVLTDESPEIYRYDLKQVLDQLARAAEDESKTNRTRIQYAPINFQLLERTNGTPAAWKRVAILSTTSTRSLDLSTEWVTSVDIRNASAALESWNAFGGGAGGAVGGGAAALSALAACGALLLAAGAALLARWAAVRRKGRRRRRDVLLLPGDFTFPVDERRRVGEGMETMLSCWLQQLHEFGGPELERPDLLKQPPHAAPKAPSAPSSTCSVNRVAAADRRIRYKGDVVHVKYLPVTGTLELKRKVTDVLLVMQNLRHENLNPFIGCLCELRPALVFDYCFRGSLEDVLMADEIKLDWTFRLSLLTDLVKGMRYLHASTLRVHGRLTSRNVVVDSRWVLRVTDHGLPALSRAMGLSLPPRSTRELLWTAPELLREERGEGRGTQAGDVFSFAIIMQEVIVRGEPYCMLSLTPDEIVEKLCRPPPLIRPSVSMGAAPPEAVSVMRQCWSEAPDLRPDFHRLHDIFRHLHRGRKINIVDSMFEMLEKYSNNLEELIKERTEQLDMEKKKTEQLLNRMLPRSVAERLLLGSRVEPEEFEEVSIYFSDIVGFTALAARSTPVQVVDMLNELYTAFDAAIEQYRVYKVETIGDAYMVVGGLPVRTPDHAEAVATMALHLLHLAGRFRLRHLPDQPLRLRIGLHSGACCAGVVGLTMPRYCLFGDTVNTASRMESTGAAWRIQVSATTAERLTAAGGYRLRSRGLTQIKGKGAMHTYWLLGKDGFDKPLPTPPPLEDEEVLFEVEGENECESTVAVPPAASPRAPVVERQRSDPSAAPDRHAWQRSGAVSADSSPPRRDTREPRHSLAPPAQDHAAPYARYRCLGNGRRPLRRQWSLERGDALAAAAAGVAMGAAGVAPASAPPSPPEPLALLATAPRAPAARYRTRRERDATEAAL